ncbi:MAG: hypothetical protein EOM21_19220 [Gammaproteobacteria bacterium]|nr:hypothetical protein [Gammaproteobacteria bacterium]
MSFPRYPAYKDSGVEWLGEVPEHWSITSLKRRARMIYGDALAADARQDGEVAVYGSNGIVGYHNEANTEEPLVVVGRKGSHGKLVWSDTAGFVIDTAYAIDSRVCDEHLRWLFYGSSGSHGVQL